MKKFRFALPIVAFLIAIAMSAFTVQTPYKTKSTSALHFFEVDDQGVIGDYIADYDPTAPADLAALKSRTGCQDNTGLCARGFNEMDPDENSTIQFTLKKTN